MDSLEELSKRLRERIESRNRKKMQQLLIEGGDEIGTELPFLDTRNEIVDNLWVGQHPNGEDVSEFRYIFCCNPRPLYNISNFQTVFVTPFNDDSILPPEEFLHETAELVAQCSRKGKTLVHCTAGINRSALITGLSLVKRGWSPEAAIKQIREKRDKYCLCNESFERWLLDQRT